MDTWMLKKYTNITCWYSENLQIFIGGIWGDEDRTDQNLGEKQVIRSNFLLDERHICK